MRIAILISGLLYAGAALTQSAPVWVNSVGGPMASAETLAVTADQSGNAYIGGHFFRTVDFDPGPGVMEFTAATSEPYLARYSAAGDLAWALHFQGRGEVTDLAIDTGGNLLVLGLFVNLLVLDANTTLSSNVVGNSNVFLAKLDTGGNLIWAFHIEGTGNDEPQALAIDSQNNITISGTIFNSADLDPGPGAANVDADFPPDAFVASYDDSGLFRWAHQFEQTAPGGGAFDSARGLAVTANDDVVVAGLYGGLTDFGLTTLDGTGTDAYIARINSLGNILWVNSTQGDDLRTEHFALDIDSSGNLIVAGIYLGTTDFDPDPVDITAGTAENLLDAYLVSYDGNGNFRWLSLIAGGDTEWITSLKIRDNNSFVVGGWFKSITDFDPGPDSEIRSASGDRNGWFSTFDLAGNLLAVHQLEVQNNVNTFSDVAAITLVEGGDLLVVGSYLGTVDFDPGPGKLTRNPGGSNDGFLTRYTSARPQLIFLSGFEAPMP